MSRRLKVAVACGAIAGIAAVGTFGPLVRREAAAAAERYGATVTIERVRPTWTGARLHGVEVSLADVPSARIHLDELDVSLLGSVRRVVIRGGLISAVGPREEVVRQAEAWRARHPGRGASGGAGSGGGSEAEVKDLRVSWRNAAEAPTESVSASNVRVSREGSRLEIAADEAAIAVGTARVAAVSGRIGLVRGEQGYRVAVLAAEGLSAQLSVSPREVSPAPAPAAPAPGGASTAAPARPRGGVADADPGSPPDRGRALRDLVVRVARAVDGVLEEGAEVRLAGVRAKLLHGEDTLNLGPGTLAVTRGSGRLLVELAPGAGGPPAEGQQALTFRLSVPVAPRDGDGGEIVADVAGGPIGLGTLGVQDSDFGLLEVARTSIETRSHVVLSGDGKRLTVDGQGKVHGLSIRSAALSDEPVMGLELAWRGKGELELDGSRIRVDEGEVDLGEIRVLARGLYERAGRSHRVKGEFEVPLTACQPMLDSVPKGLVPRLSGMRMAGSFALKGKAKIDTARLDRDFDLRWDTSNSCRITEAPPAVHVDRFRRPFRRSAYTPDGERTEIDAGPETPGWVPRSAISRFMEVAVLITEDGGFQRHHGFDEEAIRNSIRENLRAGRFVRGASTISMQLAKNLYLDRGKNLSRKLQEAVLTMYLEQELTKEQIMELYLNVVEFGPMVYGIGPAARHYFNASPSELSLGQALYISSILPNPKVQHFSGGGAVTARWMSYLHKLMEIAHKRGRVTDEELEDGLRETVVRGSPAPHRAPRDEKASTPVDGPEDLQAPEDGGEWIAP